MAVRRGRGRRPWQREWRRQRAWPLARSVFCSVLCPPSADLSSLRKQQQIDVRANKRGRRGRGRTDGRCYLCNHGPRTHARGEPASELLYSTRDRIQCDELVFGSDCLIDQRARHHDFMGLLPFDVGILRCLVSHNASEFSCTFHGDINVLALNITPRVSMS